MAMLTSSIHVAYWIWEGRKRSRYPMPVVHIDIPQYAGRLMIPMRVLLVDSWQFLLAVLCMFSVSGAISASNALNVDAWLAGELSVLFVPCICE